MLQEEGAFMLIVMTGEPVNRNLGKRRARTFRWLASAAAAQNLVLYVVQPQNVVVKNGIPIRMTGHRAYAHGSFQPCSVFHLANPIWVDFMYLRDLGTHRRQYRKLRRAIHNSGRPIVNPVLPGKDVVYSILSHAALEPGRIPATKPAMAVDDVHSFLDSHKIGWLKPMVGSGGQNIIRIERHGEDKFLVHSDRLQNRRYVRLCTSRQLQRLIGRQLKLRKYLIQEEVNLPQLQDGHRIDFRVTVQRTEEGLWAVTATTLRRNGHGAWVTNHHAGGRAMSWNSLTSRQWRRAANLTADDRDRVEQAALQAARALAHVYPNLAYLGVDVAPDGRHCYIYDCNSRPGRDILTNRELHIFLNRLVGFLASPHRPTAPTRL